MWQQFISKKRVYIMCMREIANIKSEYPEKTTANAISVAKRLLKELKINKVPIDIAEILTKLGFLIFVVDSLDDNISGLIGVDLKFREKFNSDKIILLNANDSYRHQRFTLAHEFSHYIFDFDENANTSYFDAYDTNRGNAPGEAESSRFAAEFLIPENLFKNKYNSYDSSVTRYEKIKELSDLFEVPATSIEFRIKELNLDS